MNTPTSRRGSDEGFTLVELLVVIIIIGILAAISVPVFMNQRASAYDAAAESDLKNLVTFVMGAISSTDEIPTVAVVDGNYLVNGKEVVSASDGVVLGGISGTSPLDWCIDVTHPGGRKSADPGLMYSATGGFADGQCP
ncbi:prepilin-type N-terminal cleavage/methylation domain-containing protein [Demequina sp.]|uniref:prepilin-type N-terminal cleavage/methylation domain-containing protein n=1 Tax=Demequina sp. TaxID=2050685 RepID=UPI003D0C4271